MEDAVHPDGCGLVVLGASAGGLEALVDIFGAIGEARTPPLVVVMHVAPGATSALCEILARRVALDVHAPAGDEVIRPDTVYVAPPDRHLVVDGATLHVSRGPLVNGHRPAVDTTMLSAADSYGPRAAGVVLSGMLDDGAAGLAAISRAGGTVVVQDPVTARYASMPRAALAAAPEASVLSPREIAAWLKRAPAGDPPTRFVCPDCGGVLFEGDIGENPRYQCSVGHAYSPESLLARQSQHLEAALWGAIRSLEDRAALLGRLATQARRRGTTRVAERWEGDAARLVEQAEQIRAALGPARHEAAPEA